MIGPHPITRRHEYGPHRQHRPRHRRQSRHRPRRLRGARRPAPAARARGRARSGPFEPVEAGAEVRPVRMDLSSRESIDACVDALDLTAVDLLVNNAGQMTGGLLEEQDMEEVYAMFQVNLVARRPPDAPRAPAHAREGPRHGRQQRLDQRLRATSPPPAPTRRPRPGSSRSRSRCGESSRAPASTCCTWSRRASTPTCSTRPRTSTAATWTPPLGQGRARRVGGEGARGASRPTTTSSGPAGDSPTPSSRPAGPPSLLDAISGRMFSRQPRT